MESTNTDHSDTPEILVFQMKWIPVIPCHQKIRRGMSALSRRSAWRETLALFEAMREHSVQVQHFFFAMRSIHGSKRKGEHPARGQGNKDRY